MLVSYTRRQNPEMINLLGRFEENVFTGSCMNAWKGLVSAMRISPGCEVLFVHYYWLIFGIPDRGLKCYLFIMSDQKKK